ncbi:MAG: DUF1992 domain-containing protein [Betaproteobacteria bacterium]|nr:DUF1992 domain-containing protein [Betaproteobacteria bacterium]NCV59894.1 DUF1992 domain-containing protein [Betaproteobacteria bacterium]NCW98285.1 DUF1992 domain-containing protein [Betaproteobacteria bacterium]NDB11286.1 DUF1992 domain-containing protein [Betaproteobacteria bacterium]NDB98601.1 DUF1992 domain-containing protein [Betaproteobacteria bacterium]
MKLALSWIADQRIEAAQQRGEFRNLPGEGRPLDEHEDLSLSWESRLAIRRTLGSRAGDAEARQHFLTSMQALRLKRLRLHGCENKVASIGHPGGPDRRGVDRNQGESQRAG